LAPPYFEADDSSAGIQGVRHGRWSFLFTMSTDWIHGPGHRARHREQVN
jgi:hypothetical protein